MKYLTLFTLVSLIIATILNGCTNKNETENIELKDQNLKLETELKNYKLATSSEEGLTVNNYYKGKFALKIEYDVNVGIDIFTSSHTLDFSSPVKQNIFLPYTKLCNQKSPDKIRFYILYDGFKPVSLSSSSGIATPIEPHPGLILAQYRIEQKEYFPCGDEIGIRWPRTVYTVDMK